MTCECEKVEVPVPVEVVKGVTGFVNGNVKCDCRGTGVCVEELIAACVRNEGVCVKTRRRE